MVLATIYEGVEEASACSGFATFVANTGDDPIAHSNGPKWFWLKHGRHDLR